MPTAHFTDSDAVDVILFGWGNGLPSHVAKYASIYPPGSNSLVIPSNLADFFLKSTESLAACAKQTGPALDFLQKHGHLMPTAGTTDIPDPAETRPLILHVFSNGGVLSLLATLLGIELAHKKLRRPVSALILDSAPIPRTSEAVGESAYLMTMALPRMLQVVLRPVVYAALCLVDLVVYQWLGVTPRLDVNCDALLAHHQLVHVPKLVLYSLGDGLVRPWHVERFLGMLHPPAAGDGQAVEEKVIGSKGDDPAVDTNDKVVSYSKVYGPPAQVRHMTGARVDRAQPHGGLVSVVRFPKDSAHVQHMRKYPEEYRSAVAKIIGLARL